MDTRRPTQRDIARETGLTQATVSMALNNHPHISGETRSRVLEAARQLGYRPDPYLSGLSAYRKRIRPARFHATIAWLSNDPHAIGWRRSTTFRGYYKGASERASQLGYQLEEHRLLSPDMTPQRMVQLLEARNIPGLLLAPQPVSNQSLDFDFRNFSCVTFGYTLARPRLHIVTLHQFRAMKTAFRKLLEMGYERPGLALARESDLRADNNWSAAFLSEQQPLRQRQRVPPLLTSTFNQETFCRWFNKHRPDVVLTIWREVLEWLRVDGKQVPGDTSLILLSVPDPGGSFCGIWENPEVIGSRAVEFLIDLIHRGEHGIPALPLCQLVDGSWIDGKTAPDRRH